MYLSSFMYIYRCIFVFWRVYVFMFSLFYMFMYFHIKTNILAHICAYIYLVVLWFGQIYR